MHTVSLVIEALQKIPTSVWAGILGAFATLSGVVIGNVSNNHRQRDLLMNDRIFKSRERELTLKKDLYLPAIEGLSRLGNSIATIGNLETPISTISNEFSLSGPTIEKVFLVANMELIMAIKNYQKDVSTLFLDLALVRGSLEIKRNRLATLRNNFGVISNQQNETVKQIIHLHSTSKAIGSEWVETIENLNRIQQQYNENLDDIRLLEEELPILTLNLNERCNTETISLGKQFATIITSARKELDLPFDEEHFLSIIDEHTKLQHSVFKSFLTKAKFLAGT